MSSASIEFLRRDLASNIQVLAEDLSRLAKRIRGGATPNSLGEIQGRGSIIDAKCGRLAALMEVEEERKQP
jgi:hypothetical protein